MNPSSFRERSLVRLLVLPFVALLTLGCGESDVGEECGDAGDTDECVDGAVCTNEGDGAVCRALCKEHEDCREGESCNGVSNTSLKSCQPDPED